MSDSTMLIKRKGVCTNPDCEMCISRTVQEIEPGEDFICSECGSHLEDMGGKPLVGPGHNKKLIMIIVIAVALILGGAGGWWFLENKSSDGQESGKDDINIESIEFTTKTIKVESNKTETATLAIEPVEHNETLTWTSSDEAVATVDNDGKVTGVSKGEATITVKSDRTGKEASVDVKVSSPAAGAGQAGSNQSGNGQAGNVSRTGTLNLTYGVYSGPIKAGKPDGMGGEFKFTSAMTLDLKDGYGTTVEIAPGDIINSTKFTDGKLRQGEIVFSDGRRKYISGLNQAL